MMTGLRQRPTGQRSLPSLIARLYLVSSSAGSAIPDVELSIIQSARRIIIDKSALAKQRSAESCAVCIAPNGGRSTALANQDRDFGISHRFPMSA